MGPDVEIEDRKLKAQTEVVSVSFGKSGGESGTALQIYTEAMSHLQTAMVSKH